MTPKVLSPFGSTILANFKDSELAISQFAGDIAKMMVFSLDI